MSKTFKAGLAATAMFTALAAAAAPMTASACRSMSEKSP